MESFVCSCMHVLMVVYLCSLVIVLIERIITLYRIFRRREVYRYSWFWIDSFWTLLLAPVTALFFVASLLDKWDR